MAKNLRLILVFFVAFSLASVAGPLVSETRIPIVQLAHADPQQCQTHGSTGVCSEFWYPAGPAMNTMTTPIFTNEQAEYASLKSATPGLDLPDWPCSGTPSSGDCGNFATNHTFLVTSPIAQTGYYEIEFHLDNNYWNCGFNFGNSACGVQIRQGIAHMFDKNLFCPSPISGTCTPIDNPVPTTSGGGLPSPNPCGYDVQFPQSGPNCIVGAPGGTSYHISAATGASGYPWLYAPGSNDLNAAAQHLVNAGVATGFNSSTSVLTGPVATNTPTLFIRNDNSPRLQLGNSLASQICYMFTGSYTQPCLPYFNAVQGPITAFPGFTTSKTAVNLNWWIYTAGFSSPSFFDGSIYFGYNSHFVSGIPSIQTPTGPCDPTSVPTSSASNYEYACVSTFDSLSTAMEFAPCLTSPQDPAPGQPNNGPGGTCVVDPTKLSAISAGIEAEAAFGADALTIPVYEVTVQFGYLNGWARAINSATVGLPNYFTWLNIHNSTASSIRQGFKQTTHSVNPFIASTVWDGYIVQNIYDSLLEANPLNPSQLIDWMTYGVVQETNATVMAQSGYNPPPGTALTFHFTLRNDLFFQDGRPVTSYDVAFSYLNMLGTGAFLGAAATGMTGITVLTPRVFDIGMKSVGPFTLPNLTGILIVPGRYWTTNQSTYDSAIAACTRGTPCAKSQYALSGSTVICPSGPQPGCASFAASNLQIDPNKSTATYDPIANQIFVGSGPWQCGMITSTGSGTCTSSNPPMYPGGSYTLTRFGAFSSNLAHTYFRSNDALALWIWSEENDLAPVSALSAISICYGLSVNLSGSCAHWQQGIGGSISGTPSPVDIVGLSIVERFFATNWVAPFEWTTSPPTGIAPLPPVLFDGPVTLNPCSIDPTGGYDC